MSARKRFRDEVKFKELGAEYGAAVITEVRKVMEEMADEMVAEMKELAPVKTGNLQKSIHWRWNNRNKTKIVFVADATNPKTGVAYAKVVEFSPKIQEPFMYPVLDRWHDRWHDRIVEAIRKAAKSIESD